MIEVHKIYPIGREANGDALCVEVHARGYANWYKWYGELDYDLDLDENGLLPDERPTIRNLPLVDSWWDGDESTEGRRAADTTASSAAA